MLDMWVTVLILMASFNERPEVKQLSDVFEIVINGSIAVILGVNRKVIGVLTVNLFCLKEGLDLKN